MDAIALEAKKRDITGKRVKQLRTSGLIPAVVYGHGVPSRDIAVDTRVFDKVFAKAGESSLVDLTVEGEAPVKVLIQDVQRHALRGSVIHIDFRQVRMDEKLEAQIALKFDGEAPAVKALGGMLVRSMDTVTVRCLPKDLVHEIVVNLSNLKNFEDSVKIADLTLPPGLEVLHDESDVVAIVNAPISEEELAKLDAKPEADIAAVKVAAEEKKAERAAASESEE